MQIKKLRHQLGFHLLEKVIIYMYVSVIQPLRLLRTTRRTRKLQTMSWMHQQKQYLLLPMPCTNSISLYSSTRDTLWLLYNSHSHKIDWLVCRRLGVVPFFHALPTPLLCRSSFECALGSSLHHGASSIVWYLCPLDLNLIIASFLW